MTECPPPTRLATGNYVASVAVVPQYEARALFAKTLQETQNENR